MRLLPRSKFRKVPHPTRQVQRSQSNSLLHYYLGSTFIILCEYACISSVLFLRALARFQETNESAEGVDTMHSLISKSSKLSRLLKPSELA